MTEQDFVRAVRVSDDIGARAPVEEAIAWAELVRDAAAHHADRLRERLAAAPKPPQAPELRETVRREVGAALDSAIPETWEVVDHATDRILSALAPYLAVSADVRRSALEEAARIADKKNTDLYAVEERLTASFENGLKHEYYLQRKMAQDIAAAIRAVAGSPPSAPGVPQRPHLFTDEVLRLTAELDRLAEAARKAARVLRHDIGSATRAAGALTILEEALSSFSLPPSSLAAPEKEGPCDCDKKQTKIVPDK